MVWYQFSKTPPSENTLSVSEAEPEFVNPELLEKGQTIHVYLQLASGVAKYKYRGKAGKPGDDPISFARMMAKSGLKVLYTSEFRGKIVDSSANEVE